ncbi:MAG: hypothetical protein H7175_14895, partial [Burkholderiales bacterium]|nr:hypothetical protein [Anaerolineae bacterium]
MEKSSFALTIVSALLVMLGLGLFVEVTPTSAQDAADDPASYLPADTPLYAEVRAGANLDADLNRLAGLFAAPAGATSSAMQDAVSADLLFTQVLPGVDYETNILPWVGHRIGVTGEADMSTPGEYALV